MTRPMTPRLNPTSATPQALLEQTSDSKLPGDINDDKSPGGDIEQPGTGKMSQDPEILEPPESEYTFDFRPDTSSEGSNPRN
jgi:hypothetical protein